MEIPDAVQAKAHGLIETFGNNFENLGIYQGKQVYKFKFPKGIKTGFPFIFLYDKLTGVVEEKTGRKALEITISDTKTDSITFSDVEL